MWAAEVEVAVVSGDADLGLVGLPGARPGLVEHVLRQEPLAVFASRQNRLVARDTVSVGDLRDRVILAVPQELAPGFHDLFVDMCRRAGFEPGVLDITAPGHREPLLPHLARHPDQVFVGPMSISSMPWPGVGHVLLAHQNALMPLSIIVRDERRPGRMSLALAAARAVAERERWVLPIDASRLAPQ